MLSTRRIELAAILGSGIWSLGVLTSFALGNARVGYTMLGLGAVVGTSLALIRHASQPTEALTEGA